MLSQLTEGTGTGNCFTFIHGNGAKTFNNCYYLNAIGTEQGTAVTAEQVANGELCALLGAGWRQTIGEDAYPVFDKTHAVVKQIGEAGYATMYIPDAVTAPADVEVFTGSIEKEGWLQLNALDGTVPAWEPVILRGTPGIYNFLPTAPGEETKTIVFADLAYENGQDLPTFTADGLTFSFDAGTNTNCPRYYTSGSAARIYGSNSMTVSAAQPIIKIEFAFVSNNYSLRPGAFTVSSGAYHTAITTWVGNAESVTFTNTATSQWRIVSMKVTCSVPLENIAGNVLKGAKEDIDAVGKYVLAKPEGEEVGFYRAGSGIIKAGKAYLDVVAPVKVYYFFGDDATAIKTIENGQQTSEGPIYNVAGQRLGKMQKGINIVGGKKILK